MLFDLLISRSTIFYWQRSNVCKLPIESMDQNRTQQFFAEGYSGAKSPVIGKRTIARVTISSKLSGVTLRSYPLLKTLSSRCSNYHTEASRLIVLLRDPLMILLLRIRLHTVQGTNQQDVTTFCGHGRLQNSEKIVMIRARLRIAISILFWKSNPDRVAKRSLFQGSVAPLTLLRAKSRRYRKAKYTYYQLEKSNSVVDYLLLAIYSTLVERVRSIIICCCSC